jgi:polyhydroxyalkanoate synthesis repressor PhaR
MPQETENGPKRLEIKKYPNRRYYDATHSKHLTLEEIRDFIQQGYDIRVIDARTGVDITAQLLTQLILELDTAKLDSLPVPLLVRLIRVNDRLIKDFIDKYFNQALHSFLDYQRHIEEQIRRAHGLPANFPSVSDWTKAVLEPFAAAFRGPTADTTAEPAAPNPEGNNQEMQQQVRELQRQVSELKKRRTPRARRNGGRRLGRSGAGGRARSS